MSTCLIYILIWFSSLYWLDWFQNSRALISLYTWDSSIYWFDSWLFSTSIYVTRLIPLISIYRWTLIHLNIEMNTHSFEYRDEHSFICATQVIHMWHDSSIYRVIHMWHDSSIYRCVRTSGLPSSHSVPYIYTYTYTYIYIYIYM